MRKKGHGEKMKGSDRRRNEKDAPTHHVFSRERAIVGKTIQVLLVKLLNDRVACRGSTFAADANRGKHTEKKGRKGIEQESNELRVLRISQGRA